MSGQQDQNCLFVQFSCPTVQKGRSTMDPITDLFLTTQVASVVHARLEAKAPWGLKTEANAAEAIVKDPARPTISPSQLAHFGMVSRGQCWLSVEGIGEAMPLAGGDCFLLAPGSSYTL